MKLSVLIVNYNRGDLLRSCLASIGDGVDVVVADNGSEDEASRLIPEEFPHVTWLPLGENLGFSKGVNRAAAAATGDTFLLLNPDAELLPGTLDRLEELWADGVGMGAMGFRQLNQAGVYQLSIGLQPGLLTELLRRTVQRRLDTGGLGLAGLLDLTLSRRARVSWVAGSALMVGRREFELIGGFDEEFFLYFEDIDFCLRLAASVGPVYYEPAMTVIHHRGACAVTNPLVASRSYRASQLYFWGKHSNFISERIVAGYLRVRGLMP